MSTLQILVSGDYWHEDFREQLAALEVPATMVPLERIQAILDLPFNVIVLAQSRRDQISQATVDLLRSNFPEVPIVVLLGSWCEGENRSGNPLLGVTQVYWHQWKSQFGRFCVEAGEGIRTHWHLPATATVADRSRGFSADHTMYEQLAGKMVLVSSEDKSAFESIADLLKLYKCETFWAESASEEFGDERYDVVCVDGNGVSDSYIARVSELKAKLEDAPLIAMLNFPRRQDLTWLSTLGIDNVVSKPYVPNNFLGTLIRAMEEPSANASMSSPIKSAEKTVQ